VERCPEQRAEQEAALRGRAVTPAQAAGLEQQAVLRAWAPALAARARCQQDQAEETLTLRALAPAQAVAAETQPRRVRQEEQAAQ
jgi:hypothetical protein